MAAVVSARAQAHALSNKVMNVAALFAYDQADMARLKASEPAKQRHPGRLNLEAVLLNQLLSLQVPGATRAGGA